MSTAGSSTELNASRLESLDALRGFNMIWIVGGEVVVRNLANAADTKWLNWLPIQLEHVKWSGFHFYDLIMPLFLFMVGTSIPFSIAKRTALGESTLKIYAHALRRSAILFILGMVVQCNLLAFDINKLFIIHDTLQAIAIGYLFSVIIFTTLKTRMQLVVTLLILLAYWLILTYVPVPGHRAGVLEPNLNIAKHVEQLVFGRFDDAPSPYTWFLGSLGFISTVMSGVLAGTVIRKEIGIPFLKTGNKQVDKAILLVIIGALLLAVALVAGQWFVAIKAIWNPTFVLLTSGISFLLLALFYIIIDILKIRRWSFSFKVIGKNSIAAYMGVALISFGSIANRLVFGLEQFVGVWYPMVQSAVALLLLYGILYWMYRTNTFVKV